ASREFRVAGDRRREGETLYKTGSVQADLGEKQKALDYYNQSLPLTRAVGDRRGEAITLNNIGRVYNSLGEKQKALDYYSQSLMLRRDVGDRRGEADEGRGGGDSVGNAEGRVFKRAGLQCEPSDGDERGT